MRLFVVDTNVIVSGLITSDWSAPSVRVLELMLTDGFRYVVSPELLRHYGAVLNRPSLVAIHGLHRSQVDVIVSALAANALIREPEHSAVRAEGPADQYLIDLVTSDPRYVLVAGDTRLQRAELDLSLISPLGLVKLVDGPHPKRSTA